MRQYVYILLLLIGTSTILQAQSGAEKSRGGFSLSNLSNTTTQVPDSLLIGDSTLLNGKRLIAYKLTDLLGEPYVAPIDTGWLNYYNRAQVEGFGVAIGYLGNMGSPAQSKIFTERNESDDFMFANAYDYYFTTPQNALFYNTKIPYTNISYTQAGGNVNKEERLKGVLTMNFGPKVNIGGDLDYIYARGYYNSNGDKLLSYRLFGSYTSDRYELYAYLSNANFVNYENGGIVNDRYITNPDDFTDGRRKITSKDIPVRFTNTWNRVRGKRYFFTHRYNLGFSRDIPIPEYEDSIKTVFVPVSSIIHTFDYHDNRRRFISNDAGIDTLYANHYTSGLPNDTTKYWSLKNTVGLSLREGFQDWAKFGLTAFISLEKRQFTQIDSVTPTFYSLPENSNVQLINNKKPLVTNEFSGVIGAELTKKQGNILTYNARGELAVIGDDIGEFSVTGELQTKFKLFKKEALIRANGYIKNTRPSYYQRIFHSKFFWWDNNFNNTQRIFAGGEIKLASTMTKLSASVESIQNYVFFNSSGVPQQHNKNLQVITARLNQDIRQRAFNWENEFVYQLSSDKAVLPLPQLSLYSNMFVDFRIAKVLHVQLGADVHYQTQYYAPYYQPATQQFQVQDIQSADAVKVGNFPLINAYANLKLKQARFFVMFYNLGASFIDNPAYFSLAHYPLNPGIFKMGVAVTFNN